MEGIKCSFSECRIHDFLPFECQYCKQVFCGDHRHHFQHECSSFSELPTRSTQSVGDINQPSFKEMMEKVETRHDFSIDCDKTHFKVNSQILNHKNDMENKRSQMLMKRLEENKSNVATKTRQILIAKKAKGNENINVSDRFYLTIKLFTTTTSTTSSSSSNNQEIYVYYAKYHILAEVLENISIQYCNFVYGTLHRPEGMSLGITTDYAVDWKEWDVYMQLDKILMNYETIYVIPIQTQELLENNKYWLLQIHTQRQLEDINNDKNSTVHNSVDKPIQSTIQDQDQDNSHMKSNDHQDEYVVGESVYYKTAEGTEGQEEYAVIIARHHDDYPHIYYTIQLLNTLKEKQTNPNRLSRYASTTTTTTTLSSSSSSSSSNVTMNTQSLDSTAAININNSDHHIKISQSILTEDISATSTCSALMNKIESETFSIKLSYNGLITQLNGVYNTMKIQILKDIIRKKLNLDPQYRHMKVLYKSKVMKDGDDVSVYHLYEGCKVMIMASK